MESNEIHLPYGKDIEWLKHAENEVIQRFNLKPPEGYPNYPSYCFVKKNSNRYFRKHLGFTFNLNLRKGVDGKLFGYTTINVLDPKKLMVFRIKYGL